MPARVSCPYCNAGFALVEPPASGRAECPRCGERFPVRAAEATPGADTPDPPSPAAPDIGTPDPGPRTRPMEPPTRTIGCRGLLVAALLIIPALTLLGIYLSRRQEDRVDNRGFSPDAAAVAPLSLRGLGHLPPGTNVAFAVRGGPVLAYAARTGKDPVEVVTRAGVPASVLGGLARAGVTLQQVDHIAGGVAVPDADGGELRFAVALVLREPPADEAEFLKALKARREGGRYAVEFAGLPLAMARASATDWVFALSDKDADGAGRRELPPGLREAIADRVAPEAAAWAATDAARWADKPAVKLAAGTFGRKEWLPVLEKGRAAAAGLSFGDEPRVRLCIKTADPATGEQLRAYFRGKAAGEVDGAGAWAHLDAPFDPAAGLGLFRQMLDDAGK